jgi:signal peptidase II
VQAKGRTALTLRPKNPIWKVVLLIGWAVWFADVLTKTWALAFLEGREDVKVLGNFLKLTLAKNSGAAFSMGEGGTIFLTLFSITVIFLIGYWTPKVTSRSWGCVIGLVLGGSLGNLTDRIFRSGDGAFRGHVIDWISLPRWPIFNLADSAIVIAAVLATFLTFRNVTPNGPNEDKKDEDGHGA